MGDVLIVNFDNDYQADKVVKKGGIDILYYQDEIIEYRINHIQQIMKIKFDGVIYLPNKQFIDIINIILKNNDIEELPYIEQSGYFVSEIIDILHLENGQLIVKAKTKNKIYNALTNYQNLKKSDKVVIAIPGTRLNNYQLIKEFNKDGVNFDSYICNEKDLLISQEDKVLILDKKEEIGKDFFTMEE